MAPFIYVYVYIYLLSTYLKHFLHIVLFYLYIYVYQL